jgi:FMN phosphatase YigB (HAD superfamily)
MNSSITAVFFDLGATLVEPQFGPTEKFEGFSLLPGTADELPKLAAGKLQLGIISDTGKIDPAAVREALAKVKLLPLFAKNLILLSGEVGMDKSSVKIFRLALARAGAKNAPGTCVFVGEAPAERRTASLAGLRTSKSLEAFLKRV